MMKAWSQSLRMVTVDVRRPPPSLMRPDSSSSRVAFSAVPRVIHPQTNGKAHRQEHVNEGISGVAARRQHAFSYQYCPRCQPESGMLPSVRNAASQRRARLHGGLGEEAGGHNLVLCGSLSR